MPAFTYDHPRPAVAVDLVLFGLQENRLVVLVGRRAAPPFAGLACLPGTYVRETESADDACARKIAAIGLAHTYLEQLRTYTAPDRDPRERVISIAHFGLIPVAQAIPCGDAKIKHLTWADPANVPPAGAWAFDHGEILAHAFARLRAKVHYTPIPTHLLPDDFTLGELNLVYAAVLGRRPDLSNFRRDLLRQELVLPVGIRRVRGPAATTYRWHHENMTPFFLALR
jgi:8-oxo-dGTP diphosphatase